MSTPVPVRIVAPLAGIDPAAQDGDGLAYDAATGTWRRDTATRATLEDLETRLAALEAGGGALKAQGTTGLLNTYFGRMDTSGPWTMCPVEYRVTVPAAVGDIVQWIPDLIIYRGEDSAHDLASVVGGAPARYASSQTTVQSPNGHAAMYLGGAGSFASSWPVMVWQVQAADLDGGNLTLALMYRSSVSGNRVGSDNPAAYPNNQVEVLNWGPVTASGEDLTGRVTALEDARGAANGIATLDATTRVPVAQLPVGTTSGTVAAGDDARLSDTRTPTAHAASHASGGTDPVTPAAIGALATAARGAAGGVAPLDSGLLVPVTYLPVGTTSGTVAAGDDARLSDTRTPTAHAASHASGGTDPVTPAAIGALATAARGAANGVAPLDSGLLVPVAYLPVGTTSGTVAAGDDARLSDARTPLAHTHSETDVTSLTSDLAARQLTSEKNQANGYPGLSASGRISGTQQLYATLASSIVPVGDTASVGTLDSAARSNHVHAGVNLTSDQTVGGTKTFILSPVVPDPTTAQQAASKAYADTKLATTARGAANGVASLDSGSLVPVAQLPVGTTSGTVAAGNDARLSDARTPTAHAASHASGGTDPVTPAAIGALATTARGAANGVASLDSGSLVPVAQLPVGTTSGTVAAGNTVPDLAAALEPRLQRLEHNPIREDRELFGDLLSTMPRYEVTQTVTLVNGTIYASRMVNRIAMLTTALRMAVGVVGAGGSCAIALYEGASASALSQVRSGLISMTTLGRVTHTMSSTYTTTTAANIIVAILPLAYTTAPQVGGRTGVIHSTLINPSAGLASSVTKAGQSALPSTIDLSDGTWTITGTHLLWMALG